jgi:hypothetical protein
MAINGRDEERELRMAALLGKAGGHPIRSRFPGIIG